jgi:predicted TPR repeat methyltransferase
MSGRLLAGECQRKKPMSSDAIFTEAELAYSEGRIGEADMLCRQALRSRPTHPAALHLLGKIHFDRGDHAEAIRILRQSLAYYSSNHVAWLDLAVAYRAFDHPSEAVDSLRRAICIQPKFFQAYGRLATLYYELGNLDDAAELYKEWASKDPGNPEVLHMLAATGRGKAPDRCSPTFVRTHFNKIANTFDKRLIEDLGYTGHKIACTALETNRPAGSLLGKVLDAGCGTGLCGPILRPYCRELIGVDLSDEMLERARNRAAYDELIAAEICDFVASRENEFDAILSSDVFIYIGALEQPLKAAHGSLKPNGLLIITFEALLDNGTDPYRLGIHGRYSHSDHYIRSSLSNFDFEVLSIAKEPIRRELSKDVIGYIAIARKPE